MGFPAHCHQTGASGQRIGSSTMTAKNTTIVNGTPTLR
jgi:hypothetical protein